MQLAFFAVDLAQHCRGVPAFYRARIYGCRRVVGLGEHVADGQELDDFEVSDHA